jgi:hypothetical protein
LSPKKRRARAAAASFPAGGGGAEGGGGTARDRKVAAPVVDDAVRGLSADEACRVDEGESRSRRIPIIAFVDGERGLLI